MQLAQDEGAEPMDNVKLSDSEDSDRMDDSDSGAGEGCPARSEPEVELEDS